MRKKYEVVGLVIDAKKEYEKLHFIVAQLSRQKSKVFIMN